MSYYTPCIRKHFYSVKNAQTSPAGIREIFNLFYSGADPYKVFIESLNIAFDTTEDNATRRAYIESCAILYVAYDSIQQVFFYDESQVTYKKRFIRRDLMRQNGELMPFADGINYKVPEEPGLYFIGETHFNPYTKEEFYWVKIGKSTNLAKRLRNYDTCNPMLWRIDYLVNEENEEEYYHLRLAQIAIAKCNHNEEWFLVNRETYLEMCEQGFSYFN